MSENLEGTIFYIIEHNQGQQVYNYGIISKKAHVF